MDSQLATIPEGHGTDLLDLDMRQTFWLGQQMAAAGIIKGQQAAAQASIKIMAGQALKIDPVSAMRGIFLMPSGAIGFMSNLVAARIKANPKYDYRVDALTDDICTVTIFEVIGGKRITQGTESFSQTDAKRQGTQNMAKFPKNMLFARAIGNAAKFYCPDVMGDYPIYTEADKEIMDANSTPTPPTEQEVIDENERAKAAINRSKKIKSKADEAEAKPEAEVTNEVANEPAGGSARVTKDPETVNEVEPTANDDLDRMDLGELSDLSDKMKLPDTDKMTADQLRNAIREARKSPEPAKPAEPTPQNTPKAQVEGNPETYMAPPPLPPKPAEIAPAPAQEPENEFADNDTEEEFVPHTDEQRRRIMAMLNQLGFKSDTEKRAIYFGLTLHKSFKELSFDDAAKLTEQLQIAIDNDGAEGMRMMFISESDNASS